MLSALVHSSEQVTFASGVALALLGLYLRWRTGDLTMRAEEDVKEGRLTEEQARFRLRVLRVAAPAVMVLGLGTCVAVVWL